MGVLFTNNASATIATSLSSSATSVTLTTGGGALFPILTVGAGTCFYATLVNSSNVIENLLVTARSGDVLTIVRAQDSSTASAYVAGDRLELRMLNAALVTFLQKDGSVALTGALAMGGNQLTGLADPTTAQMGATKNYADTQISEAVAANSLLKTNLNGANATGTWPIGITGKAGSASTANNVANPAGWSVTPSGTKLYFNYNGVNVASLDSAGNFIATANSSAFKAA